MSWGGAIDWSRESSHAGPGFLARAGLGLPRDDRKHPEVIVIDDEDDDIPVQLQTSHDEISCKNGVLLVFPDICPNYLTQLALQHNHKPDAVISAILDKQERNEKYPTQPAPEFHSRKRKRVGEGNGAGQHSDPDSDDEGEAGEEGDPKSVRSIKLLMATREYAANKTSPEYLALARVLLSQDFPRVPQNTIRTLLFENKNSVFETYTAMDEKRRSVNNANMPWKEKKTLSKTREEYKPNRLSSLDVSQYKTPERAAFSEFIAARELCAKKDAKIASDVEEKNNFLQAQIDGQTSECGICFDECALNRMVRCGGQPMHLFCRKCLRTQAESQIGMAKYELTCMSLDGCSAGFSRSERARFLNKKLTVALDRLEQEAVLRIAGIENLETCPFCSYAAEYPPVEVDKEFRCENPRCGQVSCRLCRKETHIPKTCAEADADRGLDARHILEEAMSEALIRRCNQCANPFVKQDGCNKIRCTKCGTLQCDVCRKTIKDYSHFNDSKRGGKAGQCPLFDASQERYEKEVSSAEAEMRKKVIEKDPNVDETALHIPISKDIQQSEDIFMKGCPVHPEFLERPWGGARQAFAEHELFGAGNHNFLPPALVMRGAVQPNHDRIPNDARDNLFRAAEGMVQRARKHIERPAAPLGMEGFGPNEVMPMPMPMPIPKPVPVPTRQRGLESLLTKVENLRKKISAEPMRPNANINRPSRMAQRAFLRPGSQAAQIPANRFDFQMNFAWPPFPGVAPLDGVDLLGNQNARGGASLEPPQMIPNFDDFIQEPGDPLFQ